MMKTVIDILENTVKRVPDNIFLMEKNSQITYSEFWRLTQKKASFLKDRSQMYRPVALLMDKSIELVSWMMACAYCGACYCVLDTRQSEERLSKMLEQLQPSCLIVKQGYEKLVSSFEYLLEEDILLSTEEVELKPHCYSNAPLYINFTSGSTGQPKGVAVSHRSVLDFIPTFCKTFQFQEDDVFANQAPLDFDVSVKDLYSAMYLGASVILIPREFFSNPTDLMDLLVEKEATVLVWAVSALCFVSIMNGLSYRLPDRIHSILFSGEVMPVKHLRKWMKFLPQARYVNLYGPTEITCNCTYEIIDQKGDLDHISIGKAFDNEWVFLLDENDQLVKEPNRIGEICVSGDCLALGYWNLPEKTATSFPLNPFVKEVEIRMYRTGDQAYYDETGKLFFQGRKDFQIKHLGHRIELGEIESVMQEHLACERACVLYDAKRSKIEAHFEGTLTKEEMADFLKKKLPSYMIPNHIHCWPHLPMTKNGKIDRQALKGDFV